jgi:hypothetical protein
MTTNTLLANSKFIELNALLNRFNIFEATDMGRREVKHTKFLSYLLNPNESHGLGDEFLCAFLSKLPLVSLANFEIMSLHTELAEVKSEWFAENSGQVDLIIKIPIINSSNTGVKYLILALENKINATQGANQLINYSRALCAAFEREKFSLVKYLLTNQDEESLDPSWNEILYKDTVIPAIKQIQQSKTEKFSAYIKYILNDYLHLMDVDEESDLRIDDLSREIVRDANQEILTKIRISSPDRHLSQEMAADLLPWHNLWLKFPKACKCLSSFDGDSRSDALRTWLRLVPKGDFKVEPSIRKYFRFSILSQSNCSKIIEVSQDAERKWINSYRHIAFEIYVEPIENKTKFKTCLKLVLGPTKLDIDSRLKLVNSIREDLQLNTRTLDNFGSEFTTIASSRDYENWGMKEIDRDQIVASNNSWIDVVNTTKINDKSLPELINFSIDRFFKAIQ